MNEQDTIADAKAAIKTVMMDYIFEPLDNITLKSIEVKLAESLSELIDMDIDFRVSAKMVDYEPEVVVYIPNEDEQGATKLTARYTDCPALSEEVLMNNVDSSDNIPVTKSEAATLFDSAMEVVDG